MAAYKIRCGLCKKNFILATWKTGFPVCYECQKKELEGEIKDPKIKKLFNIPEQLYKDSGFLRDIKIKYIKYGQLSDKQIEAFEKVVKKMKDADKA